MTGERFTRVLPKAMLEAFSDGVFAIVVTSSCSSWEVPRYNDHLLRGVGPGGPGLLGPLRQPRVHRRVLDRAQQHDRFVKSATRR
jgi:hypothetical protein